MDDFLGNLVIDMTGVRAVIGSKAAVAPITLQAVLVHSQRAVMKTGVI